jgi:uncharacterized tellurite resistance protein B-like protein
MTSRSLPRLTLDQAFVALLIATMEANQHTSPEEAARAHHIIWSMKRFRRKSGETVGRLIDDMRNLVEAHGALSVVAAAAGAIPTGRRSAAFALASDLILADGRIEPAERRFLKRLGDDLELDRDEREHLLNAMLVKNSV